MTDLSSSFGALGWEVANGVARLTLDRPAALNALDRQLKVELLAALDRAAGAPDVGAVVLTGAGRAFCVGQDLREIVAPAAADPAHGAGSEVGIESALDIEAVIRELYNPIVLAIYELEKPVVAAVNGIAAGAGMSLALACDIRIAAEPASFVAAFGRVGLVPDSGMSWLLPRIVGLGRAAQIVLGGEPVGAADAERIGVVNRVVPADRLLAEATSLAEALAAGSPLATALTKRELHVGLEVGLREALDLEARLQGIAGRSGDAAEGLAAFLEKRPPRFGGG